MTDFGRYNLILKLGQGGMGTVYLGRQKSLRRFCAIKILKPAFLQDEQAAKRFLQEARTAAALSHPNLVGIYDYDQHCGQYFIAMEYIAGFGLNHILDRHGPVPLPLAFHWLKQAAVGLEYVHSQGIVHRDIKPGNLIIATNNELKIMDLGVARNHVGTEQSLTQTGLLLGTPQFISPEQILDAKHIDHRADLYSLGITFYQMISGKVPFDDPSEGKVYLAHVQTPMPSLALADKELTQTLDGFIGAMTEKDRTKRLASASALLEAMEPWLARYPLDETARQFLKRLGFETQKVESLLQRAQINVAELDTETPLNPPSPAPAPLPGKIPAPPAEDSEIPSPPPKRSHFWMMGMGMAVVILGLALCGLFLTKLSEHPDLFARSKPAKPPEPSPTRSIRVMPVQPSRPEKAVTLISLYGKPLVLDLGNGVKLELVKILPGRFKMGSEKGRKPARLSEMPVHEVTISKPFYIGRYEVTQEQWQAVVGSNPSKFQDGPESGKRPVENVSWNDITTQFLPKLAALMPAGMTARLPTEAEWEYCCRAGSTTEYCFGDNSIDITDYGWAYKNSNETTHPVGEKKPNAWGLYDMHGNVLEWCQDPCAEYSTNSVTDPEGPPTNYERAHRGGCWHIYADWCRSANRNQYPPTVRMSSLGFRLVACQSQ